MAETRFQIAYVSAFSFSRILASAYVKEKLNKSKRNSFGKRKEM